MSWINDPDKTFRIVQCDLQIDTCENDQFRFDLNFAFDHALIPRPGINTSYNHVGCTGLNVTFRISKGAITKFTPRDIIDVDYNNSDKWSRKSGLCLKPELTAEFGAVNLKASLGNITYEQASEVEFATSFKGQESTLVPTVKGNKIVWNLSMHRGKKAVRDYILGNLYLFAECESNESLCKGDFSFEPVIVYFDSRKTPIHDKGSLLAVYILQKLNGITIKDKRGTRIHFNETR